MSEESVKAFLKDQSRGRMKNDKTKHAYLIGYRGDIQCVYGNDSGTQLNWTDPMTLTQARRKSKTFSAEYPLRIYKLVPVAQIDPEKKRDE